MVSRVLVVGSGAIGLRTAVELLRRKIPVTLRAPIHPLDASNCSIGAGGLWMPFHCDDVRTDRWALETLDEVWTLGQDKNDDTVEILPAVVLQNDNKHLLAQTIDTNVNYPDMEKLPKWTKDPRLKFQQMTVEMLAWQNTVYKWKIPTEQELKDAGYWHAWTFETPIIDAPKMLQALLKEVTNHQDSDVDVETGEYYESVDHMQEVAKSLNCDTVINCTGLGSQKVCDDKSLVGARGVLLQFDRKDCPRRESLSSMEKDAILMSDSPPWGSESHPCYMIPRGDIIAVGGTYLEGDSHPELREKERQKIMQNALDMGIDITRTKPKGEWTGFRPYRPIVCCEEDMEARARGVRVIHNYGHGGSGWTVNVGAAMEVASMIFKNKT